ncbi:hypothetical protein ACFOPP_03415 [Sphingobium sp. GCM10012300]
MTSSPFSMRVHPRGVYLCFTMFGRLNGRMAAFILDETISPGTLLGWP